MKILPLNPQTTSLRRPTQRLLALGSLMLMPGLAATVLGDDAAPSKFHAVSNFEFADKYLTPRGMIVHDDGIAFQWLALGLLNVYHAETFVSDVTLVGGVWNDFSSEGVSVHAPFGSSPTTSYVEIDPIAGVSVSFAKHLKLDVTYTAFAMQILDIGTSHHLETKLSLDDTPWLKSFALHPYVLYWQELDGKATAAQVPYAVFTEESGPGSSHYFELGIAPGYTFGDSGVKLEAPMRLMLPDPDFYGEYYDESSAIGLYEVGVKATIPLKFIPAGYGFWNFHAGFKYMKFEDKNLQGMQQFNAPGKAVDDSAQVFCGLNVFF